MYDNTETIISEYSQSSVSNSVNNHLDGNISVNEQAILIPEEIEALDLPEELFLDPIS